MPTLYIDGWVQLVSKKDKKNKKKDVVDGTSQSVNVTLIKATEINKTNDAQLEEKPKKAVEPPTVDQKKSVSTGKEKSPKEKASKDVQAVSTEKPKLPPTADVTKPDKNNIEKQPTHEPASIEAKVLEESSKSKRKKKKNTEVAKSENQPVANVCNTASESPAVQVVSEASTDKESEVSTNAVDLPQDNKKVEVTQPAEVKASNVAFDELAGLYPETKEQKKKKKVRRDH